LQVLPNVFAKTKWQVADTRQALQPAQTDREKETFFRCILFPALRTSSSSRFCVAFKKRQLVTAAFCVILPFATTRQTERMTKSLK
jgi:hypothetical protein